MKEFKNLNEYMQLQNQIQEKLLSICPFGSMIHILYKVKNKDEWILP